jgi:dihydrodipicolinate synthase/N-acetylneuraminate lyase
MIQGIWTALPDLWCQDQADRLERIVNSLLTRGISGLLALGTTGLGAELSLQNRMSVLERLARMVGDKQRLIAAISANPASDVRLLLEHANSLGIKGVAITPPFYGNWTNAELLDWVEAALGGTRHSLEIYLYHIPAAVRNGWDPELLTQVDQSIGIEGMKDSSGDVARFAAYLAWGQKRGRPFSLLVGNERLTSYCLMLGGQGVVSGLSNAYPDLMVKAYTACQQKDWDAVTTLQAEINAKLERLSSASQRQVPKVLLELARENGVL